MLLQLTVVDVRTYKARCVGTYVHTYVVLQTVYRQTRAREYIMYVPVCYPESRRGGASASSCQLAWAVVGHSCSSTERRSSTEVRMYVSTYIRTLVEGQRKEPWVEAGEEESLKISNRALESIEGLAPEHLQLVLV